MKVSPRNLLNLSILGTPLLQQKSQPHEISRRQTRALLYYLAAHPEPVSRDQLTFLFWPDEGDASARRKLSRLLTHLRSALPAADCLLTPNDQVALNTSLIWCDASEFRRHCGQLAHRSITWGGHTAAAQAVGLPPHSRSAPGCGAVSR